MHVSKKVYKAMIEEWDEADAEKEAQTDWQRGAPDSHTSSFTRAARGAPTRCKRVARHEPCKGAVRGKGALGARQQRVDGRPHVSGRRRRRCAQLFCERGGCCGIRGAGAYGQ